MSASEGATDARRALAGRQATPLYLGSSYFRDQLRTLAHLVQPRLKLTILGGLAEFERDLMRSRTTDGRERAKANGVKMGRPPKLTAHQKKEALKPRDAGEPTREIARMFNVSHSTISRLEA